MDNYETGIYTDNPDDTLRYMKSAEVVEVVRCKDCKHWAENTQFCGELSCSGFIVHRTPPEWFCADGERRTE